MRPRLAVGVRWLWRGPTTLQLGADPSRAVLLTGVDPAVRRLLGRLDGTVELREVLAAGRQAGVPDAELYGVVDQLAAAGMLDDAAARVVPPPGGQVRHRRGQEAQQRGAALVHRDGVGGRAVLARRATQRVEVHGAGRLGATLVLLLASEGVGRLRVVDDGVVETGGLAPAGADSECLGLPRPLAVRDRVDRLELPTSVDVASTDEPVPPDWHPDLVVVSPDGGRRPALMTELMRRAVPCLLVEVRETSGVVGPLVIPGRTSCQRCHDLHRTDRDPDWPAVVAQLDAEDPTGVEVLVASAAAVVAATQTLAHLDGLVAEAIDGTLEASLPTLRWRRRAWTVHPSCGCQWSPGVTMAG